MIKALLAAAVVVRRMTVSIMLLILLVSPYPSSSMPTNWISNTPATPFLQEVIFSANFEDNSGDNNWTLTSLSLIHISEPTRPY